MFRTIMEKLKMNKLELIDRETVETIVRKALGSLPSPSNCYLSEVVEELGLDLAHLLRWGLERVTREQYETWILTRRLPGEGTIEAAGGYIDPMVSRPLGPLSKPKSVSELVDVARRAAGQPADTRNRD
jgi:hypothetical protein